FQKIDMENLDIKQLPELERYMLHRVYELNKNFKNYFKSYDFHNLYKELLNFCTVDLSAFYFDIRKDALYCDSKDSARRKSCIVVLNIILESLIKWFAPILSFTTEEIFTLISKDKKSIHLEEFMEFPKSFENEQLNKKWIELKKIRDICNISIEAKRASKEIGSSLEANISINLDEKMINIFESIDFSELCITSSAIVKKTLSNEITVITNKAEGEKCSVCWKINKNGCERHPN
ncbi:MAG: class I tRNA ligase family protein, partial [Pelagibacterales bacterium]|nr:class I tRNA ligase family protein [Pelagibacterales bacterium]